MVAHSFGTVPAVQALARFPSALPIRLITLGSPMRLMAARAPHLDHNTRELAENAAIESWHNFYSDQDWLCTAFELPGRPPRFTSNKLDVAVSLAQMASGASHEAYFHAGEAEAAFRLMLNPFGKPAIAAAS